MGARASIVIRFPHDREITLYAHWHGRDMPRILRESLTIASDNGRADDPSHVAWVVATQLRALDEGAPPSTDFAIAPYSFGTDPEHGEYHVDPARGVVEHVQHVPEPHARPPSWRTRILRTASFVEVMDGAFDAAPLVV